MTETVTLHHGTTSSRSPVARDPLGLLVVQGKATLARWSSDGSSPSITALTS